MVFNILYSFAVSCFQKMKPSSSSSHFQDKLIATHSNKRERCLNVGRLAPILLSSIAATTVFSFFLYFPNPFAGIPKHDDFQHKSPSSSIHTHQGASRHFPSLKDTAILNCDLFTGEWIRDPKGWSRYTNSSCGTIPESKNCFKHGRMDRDFLKWRWKPEGCDLPRFDPKTFLDMVRGSKMAFIGDSVAKNHMDSLLCLLSLEEMPKEIYRDSEDRNMIWHFPDHDFTLMILWSKFLVAGEERVINGSLSGTYDLHLDKIDPNWTPNLQTIDYAILSGVHWFFRPIYVHEGDKLVGCVYCNEPNVTNLNVGAAIRTTLRAALNHINSCRKCRGIVTLVRTFSPAHFENGSWNTGGSCNRTGPFGKNAINEKSSELELRKIQIEEVERAKKVGDKHGKSFGIVDVTRAMMMRADGHPGVFWDNKWMKGYSDCVHWCLPGPIDVWNDFLMATLEKETGLVSASN